jgi:hypothetical protein
MTVGSTQTLTEMSTRNISWGDKGGQGAGQQPYHLHVPIVLKSGSVNLWNHEGLYRDCFTYDWEKRPIDINYIGLLSQCCV